MSETPTELLTPISDDEVHEIVSTLRLRRLQRSTANVIIAVGALALILCFPLMRVVVSEYTLGAELSLSTESCALPQYSSDVEDYCKQAKAGVEPASVQFSKAIVGSPLAKNGPLAQAPTSIPLQATPVPGQDNKVTIALPNGTVGSLVLPQPAPSTSVAPDGTTREVTPPLIVAQPPTSTVVAPSNGAPPTTVIPIEPPPTTTSTAVPPPVETTSSEASSSVAPPPAQTTTDAPPPAQTTEDAPPPAETTTEAPPPPVQTTDTTVAPTQSPEPTTTTPPPTEPPATTESSPPPSLLDKVVDSLAGVIMG